MLRAMIAREQLHTEQHQSVPELPEPTSRNPNRITRTYDLPEPTNYPNLIRITRTYYPKPETRNPKINAIPENWVVSCCGR